MERLSGSQSGVLFEVQKIIGISVGSGNIRTYHVQWAPAWVSGYHLVGCEHLIQEFLKERELDDCSVPMATVDKTTTADKFNFATSVEGDGRNLVKNMLGNNTSCSGDLEQIETTGEFDGSFSSSEHIQEDLHPDSVVFTDEDTIRSVSDVSSHAHTTFVSVSVKIEDNEVEKGVVADECHRTGSPGPSKSSKSCANIAEQGELMDSDEIDCNRKADKMLKQLDTYFQDNSQLSQETNNSDAESEENSFSIAADELDSVKHLWVHTGPGQYQCVPCGKPTRSKSELRRHLRIHTGERPFKCSVCGKSFSWKECLTSHLKLHAGQRYTCTLCLKTFSDKSNLSRHVKRFCKGSSI